MFAGALMALLAALVLAPSSARAGCSHYVRMMQAEAAGQGAGLELLALAGVDGAADEAAPNVPQPPRPCTGVFCSGTPALPDVPTAPPSLTFDQFGLLDPPIAVPTADSFLRQPDDDRSQPQHAGSGVFHPPRPLV